MKRIFNLLSLPQRKAPPVGTTPADVVHRENKWRLLRYKPTAGTKYQTPVLLVPSLINRHYVLDLMPGKSFTEYLVAQGHTVFTVDWGTPGDEDRYLDFDTVTDHYLGRAIRVASQAGPSGKAHVLGYCLGGTLAAIHAAARPERLASLVCVAAPVKFHDGGLLSTWTNTPSFDLKALVEGAGNVPWQLMQSAFHMLRPTMNLSKAVHLIDRAWDDEYLNGLMALETWGNDNVSFPGACYEQYVDRLYRRDLLSKGELMVGGRPAKLSNLTAPLLAVTFEHDNIVPLASAKALLDLVSSQDKTQIHLPGGHVGAMVSKAAAKGLWPQISGFWAARDGAVAATAAVAPSAPLSDGELDAKLSKIEKLVEKIEQAEKVEKAPRPASKASAAARKKN
jgi:polyhydroxyalkanoate synthase